MAKNVLQIPGRALDFSANFAGAVVSGNRKAALSSILEVISFCHTGEGFDLGKFV